MLASAAFELGLFKKLNYMLEKIKTILFFLWDFESKLIQAIFYFKLGWRWTEDS